MASGQGTTEEGRALLASPRRYTVLLAERSYRAVIDAV